MCIRDRCKGDMEVIMNTIRNEQLPKFTKEREKELTIIMQHYAQYMKVYAEKNLALWKKGKEQLDQ